MDIFSYFDFCECRRNAFRSLSNKLTWLSDACTYVIHTIEWSGQFYSWRDLVVLIARYLKKNRLLSFEIRDSKSNHNLIKNYVCLFVSWVGWNLCLTNWIPICSVPRGTNETRDHWNSLCSPSPKPRSPSTPRRCNRSLDLIKKCIYIIHSRIFYFISMTVFGVVFVAFFVMVIVTVFVTDLVTAMLAYISSCNTLP